MKHKITVLFVFVFLLLLSGSVYAQESGICGIGVSWSFDEGVLTVTGEGEMFNYGNSQLSKGNSAPPWLDMRDEIEKVVIEKGVMRIGQASFYGCRYLNEVVLGEDIKEIGYGAFSDCVSLKEINIPHTVSVIEPSAFALCYSLENISLPQSLKEISTGTFYKCESLKKVEIPKSVTYIGQSAFSGSGIEEITIPGNVKTIGREAFSNCLSLNRAEVSEGVLNIGYAAFSGSENMKYLTLGQGLQDIGEGAFYECHNLSGVKIPDSVKNIGKIAFYYCTGITSLTIENGVNTIGEGAFSDCSSLQYVEIPESVKEIGKNSFAYNTSLLRVLIKEGCERIGEGAFLGCGELLEMRIPNGIKEIGASAFTRCSKLRQLYIPASTESIGNNLLMSANKIKTVNYGGSEKQWIKLMNDQNRESFKELKIIFESDGFESDYPSQWAAEDIERARENGLIPGELDFRWDYDITRGEFCRLIKSLFEVCTGEDFLMYADKSDKERVIFSDTADTNIFAAAKIGIINGYDDGTFRPDDGITREEAAVMLTRCAEILGIEIHTGDVNFADWENISPWARDSVSFCYVSNIMNGISDGETVLFRPKLGYTREQSAVTILRLYDCFKNN